ncbi:MAG: serine/threonine protein kinase [Deltaproteobacteria bacterium]|nr:serine/threonine protein kinase [Deltaproteobacteria bacterium]
MKPKPGPSAETIPATIEPTVPATPRLDGEVATEDGVVAGYTLRRRLGVGGMGEIVAATDVEIGREVAIKRLKTGTSSDDAVVRFLREAKIQARLDHPSIVPVYEIGHDDQQQPYFTMKSIAGVTLHALIVQEDVTLQRLLRAFVDVAQAVEFAHSRGIVHRDLKPANIMIGDLGEVYVLDWGLARGVDERPEPASDAPRDSQPGVTALGAVLGTPGYMAPEQVLDASTVGPAADVYALGAILYEILVRAPLHPRDNALASTLDGELVRPTVRRADGSVPPELEALCMRALDRDREARPSARELADVIQRYLDGDRDVETRRGLARAALADAHGQLAANRRSDAIQAAGRALALDPSSTAAADVVMRLMLEPPAESPPELRAELRAAEAERVAINARTGFASLVAGLLVIGAVSWNGVEDPALVGTCAALVAALAITAISLMRRPADRDLAVWWLLIANSVLVGFIARVCGPLVAAPAAAGAVCSSLLMFPLLGRHWVIVLLTIIGGWFVPVALEATGMISRSWEVIGDVMVIRPIALSFEGPYTALLFAINAVMIAIGGAHLARLGRLNLVYEREILSQRWHYQQLIPQPQPDARLRAAG